MNYINKFITFLELTNRKDSLWSEEVKILLLMIIPSLLLCIFNSFVVLIMQVIRGSDLRMAKARIMENMMTDDTL